MIHCFNGKNTSFYKEKEYTFMWIFQETEEMQNVKYFKLPNHVIKINDLLMNTFNNGDLEGIWRYVNNI